MSNLYNVVALSTVVKINSGIALPKIFKNVEFTDGEYEFFKVAQMNNDNKVMKNADLKFTLSQSKEFKIKLFPKGSILIPKRGGAILTNKKRILLKDASYDSNIMGLKADNEVITDDFLFTYMDSIDLSDYIDTSTIPQINNKHIEMMMIPLPSLAEQKRIVSKLDTLFASIDKAISLHQKNIDEANVFMASVLNDVFVELEEKYEKKQLKNIVDNYDGKRIPIKSSDRESINGIYPYYGASGIIDYVNDYIFDGEYLLISEDGANLTVRKYPIAFIATGKFWVNNHAHIVSAKENISSNKFMEYAFAFTDISDYITGSAQPKMSQGKMNLIEFVIPPLQTQQKVVTYLDEISQKLEKIKQLQKEKMAHLKALKASILDSAFRGEL